MSGGGHEGRMRSDGGLVLPIVLLMILGLMAVATSVFSFVAGESLLGRRTVAFLDDRGRAEEILERPPASGEVSGPFERTENPLRSGFVLVRISRDGSRIARYGVVRKLDHDSAMAELPGAAEAPGPAPTSGVVVLPACASARSRPLVREPRPDAEVPTLAPPRLGNLTAGEILARVSVHLSAGELLPGESQYDSYGLPGGGTVPGGTARGLLVSTGDLTLGGATRFEGLIVASGALHMEAGARVDGIVLAGGPLQVADDALLRGCPDLVSPVLELPAVAAPRAVAGGALLGRY